MEVRGNPESFGDPFSLHTVTQTWVVRLCDRHYLPTEPSCQFLVVFKSFCMTTPAVPYVFWWSLSLVISDIASTIRLPSSKDWNVIFSKYPWHFQPCCSTHNFVSSDTEGWCHQLPVWVFVAGSLWTLQVTLPLFWEARLCDQVPFPDYLQLRPFCSRLCFLFSLSLSLVCLSEINYSFAGSFSVSPVQVLWEQGLRLPFHQCLEHTADYLFLEAGSHESRPQSCFIADDDFEFLNPSSSTS